VTPADLKLILVALVAIGALVLLVTRFKVNAFISLLLASLIVGLAAVAMGAKGLTITGVVKSFGTGLGNVMAGIAAVIGLGTMLGKLLAESGGAEVLAKGFAKFFGPKRIQWCVMALALAVGLTTWFAVGFVLLLAYLVVILWILKIAGEARDRFGATVCVGVAAMIFWHVIINIGMVSGTLPVVGVTLPLISYGGSSILTTAAALGLVMNVSVRRFSY